MKKILLLLCVLGVLLALISCSNSEATGDLNYDGEITISDYSTMRLLIIYSDFNDDGVVDEKDIDELKNMIANGDVNQDSALDLQDLEEVRHTILGINE